MWHGGTRDEDRLLAACYRRCLHLAGENGAASLAFPAISTGVYGFPAERAAKLAVTTILAEPTPARVVLCCFSPRSAQLHREALRAAAG